MIGRRAVLAFAVAGAAPGWATTAEVATEIEKATKGVAAKPGLVTLDLAQMVENGNAVGVIVSAEPPAGTTVASLHLFAEGNPNPEVFHAQFGPAAYAARLATRMRLATSQNAVAIAVMADGSCWRADVTVMVTQAACLE